MPYVFYDTETTGIETDFDQILQFAAIRTDDNLTEVDRFSIRCRLLPHVVPSPGALRLTHVTPAMLTDPAFPSHYEMIRYIRGRLLEWSPATFIGFNSMKFDEKLLRQALFQTLHPAYLTNTNGNARSDAMRLKRFSDSPCTRWADRGTPACTDAGGPMRAYSMDLRERALLDSDAGMKAADVAAKYRVSGSWVRLLQQRRRETGEVAPRVQRHGRRPMLEPHLHTLAALIAAQPDRTLAELKDALATPASVPTVWRAVHALGLTVKKNGPPIRTRSA